MRSDVPFLTLLHSERPKLHAILAFLSATGLMPEKGKTHKAGLTFSSTPGKPATPFSLGISTNGHKNCHKTIKSRLL